MSDTYCVFLASDDPDFGDMPKAWEVVQYPTDKKSMARSFFQCISKAGNHNPIALALFPAQGRPRLMAYEGAIDLSYGFQGDAVEKLLKELSKAMERFEEMAGVGQGILDEED